MGNRADSSSLVPVCALSTGHGEALKSMAYSMPEVKRLAQPMLQGVDLDDMLLNGYRLCHHPLKLCEVGIGDVIIHEFSPHRLGIWVYETVLEHLSVSRAHLCIGESGEELCVKDNDI